jgi:hypothetical protein
MGFCRESAGWQNLRKRAEKVDFPDCSSVLRQSGDLSESEISTILKKEHHD